MYNGSSHFGRAYQEELLRAADFEDGRERQSLRQAHKPGILSRLLSAIFHHRDEPQPYIPAGVHNPDLPIPK